MAISYNPRTITDGLVLCLDAANPKGYDRNENLLLYSEDFSNAYWTKSNVNITSNAITSPTGSSNASKLVENASTSVHELIRGSDGALSIGTDTYITLTIFAKAAERQYCYIRSSGNSKRIAVVVDLSNGTFNVTNWGFTLNSSATVTAYPNGWYRITCTSQSNYPAFPGWAGQFIVSPLDTYQLASNVGGSGYSYAGNGTSGIYIWGATYEFGPGISNYYATAGTAKNRGSTLIDLSGNGNTGTLTNGPTYSSSNGGSIVFDGTNDTSSFGNILQLGTESRTYCCWYKLNSTTQTDYASLISKTDNSSTAYRQSIGFQSNGNFRVVLRGASNSVYDMDTTNPKIDLNWHYLVWILDRSSTQFLYQDNVFLNSLSISAISGQNFQLNRPLRIGSYNNNTDAPILFFNGNIAQVSIYNRALSAAEIQQNFNATRSRYSI